MNTENKIIIIVLIITFIIGIIILMYINKKETIVSVKKQTVFEVTSNKFKDLHNDLKKLFISTINYDLNNFFTEIFLENEDEVLKCVENKMNDSDILFENFNMDGDNMSEPILSMYNKNLELYNILGECKFLQLVGRTIALVNWIIYIKKSSEKDIQNQQLLENFLNCLKLINWNDINVWKTISEKDGTVMTCITG